MVSVGPRLILLAILGWMGISAASGQKNVRAADLLNRTIESGCPNDKARSIKLKNGGHTRIRLLADGDPDPDIYEVKGVADLDVTGDRRKEAILYAECHLNGVGAHELLVFRHSVSGPVIIARASYNLLGFASVKSITLQKGMIIVAMNYRELPGVPKTEDHFEFRYSLKGRNLKLEDHGRISAKPTTER